jgi:hypothetical protein
MGYVTRSPGGVSIARQRLAHPSHRVGNESETANWECSQIGRERLRQTVGLAFCMDWLLPVLLARRVQEEGLPRKGGCADDAVPAGTAQEEPATVQLPRTAEHMRSRLPRGGRGSCRKASVAPSRRKAGGGRCDRSVC